MTKVLCIFSILLVLVSNSKSDYVAAVVEYQILNSTSANLTVQANLDEYIRLVENARQSSVQIIVFPEYGLTGLVDDPKEYAIEIPTVGAGPNFTDNWLQQLSNGAKGHGMYVVVNLLEKTQNKRNETIYYNTNVVFDKDGKLIAKYRKINLYEEPLLTPGNPSENHGTFNTDFGITFGLFTCFDMFFYDPSRAILANSSVTDVIFSTAWYSILPFLHSLSFHAAYAQANKVNLLVSNVNDLPEGIGGSGIYGADGTVASYFISGSPKGKLVIGNVRTTNQFESIGYQGFEILDDNKPQDLMTGYNAGRYFDSQNYIFKSLNLSQGNISEQICYRDFCCTFNITVSVANSSDIYKLMAYVGPNKLGSYVQNSIKICSLLACETDAASTCGTRDVNITSKFRSITVKTDVVDVAEEFYQPITLTKSLLPIFNTTYNSSVDACRKFISFSTGKVETDVVAFGIYGSSAENLGFSLTLLVVSMIAKYLLQ